MDEQRRSVRDAAVEQAVTTLVYIGLMLALSYVLANRDAVKRAGMRLESWWNTRGPADDREAAEFNRRVSDYDHGDRP